MKRKQLKGKDLKEYCFQHVKQRLDERFGLYITKREYQKLHDGIDKMEIISRDVQKEPQLVLSTVFKGVKIHIVYNEVKNCITTVII
jgi:hypothetical protein